ncbi:MAG TPA: NADH dehydrogenase (quinone) subunit G [Gammaproteobacteria bacterium]|nr:NADH dehydrogenase (quinone) subunit G [Gammaproteobacteria bacterium]
MVTITVDGREMQAPKGAMLIEVTDANRIHVPRFCYHKKLPIAANCRMCLVEVEKAPKPLPACATPVMDGMVVRTQSQIAKDAQKSVMEFLLINHPLDCPICDQGGECELQDVAMAYGQDSSEYCETKHVVFDKNIGPLIATELTRCIHCTRCVRFGREIAGMRELGMTGRGENSLIATFVDECVNSEMSGNSIDVCPVGALTAKPSRFKGRAWEMIEHKTVAPHDCIGSNLFVHTLRGEIIRVVPRENESINEVWLSDRDRFSYEGLDTEDRLTTPMIKVDGQWQSAGWDEALQLVADKFKALAELKAEQAAAEAAAAEAEEAKAEEGDADEAEAAEPAQSATTTEMAALVSPNATLEELYLAQKLLRGLGSGSIEHRLRQSDFSDEDSAPVMPWLGQSIEQLEQLDAALLIGSNVRKEQPIANLRLRKAATANNAQISFLNPRRYAFNYPVAQNIVVAAQDMVAELAAIAAAAFAESGNAAPAAVSSAVAAAEATDAHREIAKALIAGENSTLILGNIAAMHPAFSALRTLADAIATATDSRLGYLSDGANAAGAWLAGAVPHRGAGGQREDIVSGNNLAQITATPLAAALLLNIEPDTDAADASSLMASLDAADFVVSLSSYNSASVKQVADVMLPAAAFTESSGTYVNAEGYWQSFNAVVEAPGISRPAWKILRVLGNLCGVDGFDYVSSEDVKNEVRAACESLELSNAVANPATVEIKPVDGLQRAADVPMYAADAIVRRAASLQQTVDAQTLCARINAAAATLLDLDEVSEVEVSQDGQSMTMPLVIDDSIPDHCVWVATAMEGNDSLGAAFAPISIEKAG